MCGCLCRRKKVECCLRDTVSIESEETVEFLLRSVFDEMITNAMDFEPDAIDLPLSEELSDSRAKPTGLFAHLRWS